MSDFEDQSWVKLGVGGALHREATADQRKFMAHLAETLLSALPDETEVKHRFLSKAIVSLTVTLGDCAFVLEDPGKGPLKVIRAKIVRGITLKRDEIPMTQWVEELGEALESRVAQSTTARQALATMLGLE